MAADRRDSRLRAERRAGELLAEMKATGQRATVQDGASSRAGRLDKPALRNLGISKDQSSAWQKVAAIPEPVMASAADLETLGIIAQRAIIHEADLETGGILVQQTTIHEGGPARNRSRSLPGRMLGGIAPHLEGPFPRARSAMKALRSPALGPSAQNRPPPSQRPKAKRNAQKCFWPSASKTPRWPLSARSLPLEVPCANCSLAGTTRESGG